MMTQTDLTDSILEFIIEEALALEILVEKNLCKKPWYSQNIKVTASDYIDNLVSGS
jgi:hypothetical protein